MNYECYFLRQRFKKKYLVQQNFKLPENSWWKFVCRFNHAFFEWNLLSSLSIKMPPRICHFFLVKTTVKTNVRKSFFKNLTSNPSMNCKSSSGGSLAKLFALIPNIFDSILLLKQLTIWRRIIYIIPMSDDGVWRLDFFCIK